MGDQDRTDICFAREEFACACSSPNSRGYCSRCGVNFGAGQQYFVVPAVGKLCGKCLSEALRSG